MTVAGGFDTFRAAPTGLMLLFGLLTQDCPFASLRVVLGYYPLSLRDITLRLPSKRAKALGTVVYPEDFMIWLLFLDKRGPGGPRYSRPGGRRYIIGI